MVGKIELDIKDIDFRFLFKVTEINVDRATFKKYGIKRLDSENEGKELIDIGEEIGKETHLVTPDIAAELAGNVGMLIKGFKVVVRGKSRKKSIVSKIIKINDKEEKKEERPKM